MGKFSRLKGLGVWGSKEHDVGFALPSECPGYQSDTAPSTHSVLILGSTV